MYVAIVLDQESHEKLVSKFSSYFENNWQTIAHHMTIHMGRPTEFENANLVGQHFSLLVSSIAFDKKVVAAGIQKDSIEDEVLGQMANKTPHVTIAVNRNAGGKPVMSNGLTNWTSIEPFIIRGRYEEVA